MYKNVCVCVFFFRRLFKYNISFRLLRAHDRKGSSSPLPHTPTRPSESVRIRTKDFGGYYLRILSHSTCVVFFFFVTNCRPPHVLTKRGVKHHKNPFFLCFFHDYLVCARFVGNGNKKNTLFSTAPTTMTAWKYCQNTFCVSSPQKPSCRFISG